MSHILIINTGGTIGMTKTENGYRPDSEYFKKAIYEIDELKLDGMPEWDFVQVLPLLDSSCMTVDEWNKIGYMISDNYDRYDGFVILHGTDTMAYTASALSFMFSGLDKPVILTGSQIPLCELRSDGRDNLVTSLIIAGQNVVREVCIYFGGMLLRGNRSMKYSADGLTAFTSPNFPPLARVGIDIIYSRVSDVPSSGEKFSFVPMKNVPIGVLKVFPGIQFSLFEPIMTHTLKGIVLETFGSGNIPDGNGSLLPIIKKAKDNGTILVVCSQCPQGTVNIGAYEAGSALKKEGAVSGRDLTTEAAVTKLYYLFSVMNDASDIEDMMGKDIRGEMTV